MSFYTYRQNNSGGGFDFDEIAGISIHVIIEADSADEANERAEEIGLYFDGRGDCSCCGDRWHKAYGDGDDVPSIYGSPLWEYRPIVRWLKGSPEVFIHFQNGGRAEVTLPGK